MIFIVTEFTSTEFGSVLCVQEVTELKDRHTAVVTATHLDYLVPTVMDRQLLLHSYPLQLLVTTLEHSVSYTTMNMRRELLLLCT